MGYGSKPNFINSLIDIAHELSENRRIAVFPVIIELGRVTVQGTDDVPQHPGPIVTDEAVIRYLVNLLSDENKAIRDMACSTLAGLVPSTMLVPHGKSILQAIENHPESEGSLILLGKVGNPAESLDLLERAPELGMIDADNVIMVRARLGDKAAEEALYNAYYDAEGARQKGELARRLGYAATNRLIAVLADEIRSPDFYLWRSKVP